MRPPLTRPRGARYDLQGAAGRYLRAVTDQWLLPAPAANPAMLEISATGTARRRGTSCPGPGSSPAST